MITYDRIRVEGALGIQKILALQLHITANEHATAIIEGAYDSVEELLRWQTSGEMQEIKILIEGEKSPLFCGYLKEAKCHCEASYHTAKLTIVSATILLDRQKLSASYQNVTMTYEDVVLKTIQSTQKAACICTIGRDTKLGKPLIQYAETDWQFVKRLASHFHSAVYPEMTQLRPAFWFGKPSGESAEINAYEYRHGISRKFYELGGKQAGLEPRDFEYYVVKTSENLSVGTKAAYQNRQWIICEKHAAMEKNELIFTYTLGKEQLVSTNKIFNPVFAGMSILGKVLETGGETVKLHLDIDKEQEKATAYPYIWSPDTSSVMYCMPKVGTTVSLYFSNEDETSGRAVNCIRENGSTCEAMSNPENRALTTEHGKQLFLNTDSMGFDTPSEGHTIRLEDETGLNLSSEKMIRIVAGEGLLLKGKRVSLETGSEITMARKGGEK